MGHTIFTTKKMKLESKSWIKRSMIGTVILAIIGAGIFGGYSLVNNSDSESRVDSHSKYDNRNSSSSAPRQSMLPAYARKSEPVASFANNKRSSHEIKNHGLRGHHSTTGKKFASKHSKKHHKHHGKKYAKAGKQKKHKFAIHKKHSKKHLAHQKHGKGKKSAHKKNKSSHKLAQR